MGGVSPTFTWNKYADMLTKEAAQEAKEKEKLPPVISMGDVKEVQVCQMAGDMRVGHSFLAEAILGNAVTSQHGVLLSDDIKALKTNR